MRAIRVPSKAKQTFGKMILHPDLACPFEPDNDFEDALLFYLHKISNDTEDQLAAIQGEIDNVIECRLIDIQETLSTKLDSIIGELQRLQAKEVQ